MTMLSREDFDRARKHIDAARKKFEDYHEGGCPVPPEAMLMLAHASRLLTHADAADRVIEGLREALVIVMPMAKGYAIEHPVGNNAGMVETAQAALDAAGNRKEKP